MRIQIKPDLLLLHGALGSKDQFVQVSEMLQEVFTVHSLNFSGHGGSPLPDKKFSIELFESDIMGYLDKNSIASTFIFGYSMGGYIGLSLAANHPGRVKSVFTLATKFDWNYDSAQKETSKLNPETILQKVPAFAEQLKSRHHPQDWKLLLNATSAFMMELGIAPLTFDFFKSISCPVQVAVGDRDKMVSLKETNSVFEVLNNGSLLVLPGTNHPFESISMHRLVFEIKQFCR